MTFKRWLPTFLAFPIGGELAIATLGSLDDRVAEPRAACSPAR